MMKTYHINEIFYSLQGEGYYTGTPSLFIRFSGCNLNCTICDTDFRESTPMTLEQIAEKAAECPARHVVLTGGEPSLQVDEALIDELHALGKYVAIETNGTHPLPKNIDWITLSPKDQYKSNATPVLTSCNELKVVFDGSTFYEYPEISAEHRFLQPLYTDNATDDRRILIRTIIYVQDNPSWRLSLQTHKFIGIR